LIGLPGRRRTSGAAAGSRSAGAGAQGAAGLTLTFASVLLTWVIAALGPSLAEPPLPGRAGQPPWSFAAHPSAYLVVSLIALSLAAGTAGLVLTIRAARRGWLVPPGMLLTVGLLAALALAFVPPFGSSDHLNYAAYGRIAATGHDPYTMTPAALARLGDPVGRAVRQFQGSPSVYGTLATAAQTLAAAIGAGSARLTVFVLSLLNVAAFGATGLLLHLLARGDRRRQLRAALLWTLNPLLLQVLVAGQHVDSQAVVFAVAAIAAFSVSRLAAEPVAGPGMTALAGRAGQSGAAARWGTALPASAAGVLIGLGFAVKVTMSLAGAGIGAACLLTWLARRENAASRTEPLAAACWLAAGFAVTAGASLAVWGVSSLTPSLRAGSYVSNGSPWRTVRVLLHLGIGESAAESVVKLAAIGFGVFLLAWLLRSVSGWSAGWPVIGRLGADRGRESWGGQTDPVPVLNLVIWVTFAVALAWLFSWPYVLPWYDAIGWALLALMPWSALDWLMVARTAALAFGYLTGSGTPVPGGLTWLETVVRTGLTPAVLLTCAVVLVLVTRRARQTGTMRS
jgi:hypothetical protein